MDSLRFDRLTRRFAKISVPLAGSGTGVSRRTVLRGAAGVMGVGAVGRASQPASAALCPNRVPRPNHTPTINGCGPSGFGWGVPDSFGRANFTPACNRHDRCYGTCNENRMKCDFLMRKSMKAACKRAYRDNRKWRARCNGVANLYFNKVRESGLSAYEAAQNEACECCPPGAEPCGGRKCCPPGFECCNGTCRQSSVGPWDACDGGTFCCGDGQECCEGRPGFAACCTPGHICVADCLGPGIPGCCPPANPGCCNVATTGPSTRSRVVG